MLNEPSKKISTQGPANYTGNKATFAGFGVDAADMNTEDEKVKPELKPSQETNWNSNVSGPSDSLSGLSNAFGSISFAPTTHAANNFTPLINSAAKTVGGKKVLGAKKAAKINFEEAEKRAKQEQELLKASELERQRLEASRPVQVAQLTRPEYSSQPEAGSNKYAAERESVQAQPKRFGFGFDPSEMPKTEVVEAPLRKVPTGFGNAPHIPEDKPAVAASSRFSNSKAISSDQYFERGDFDPNGPPSSQRISSDMDGNVVNSFSLSATDFAAQFSSQAQEDFENVKRLVSSGGAKLSEMLADIQVFIFRLRVSIDMVKILI